jgi:hypothetical protein
MEDVAPGYGGTEAARAIARRCSRIDPASIDGTAFDTLFKQPCAEQARTRGGFGRRFRIANSAADRRAGRRRRPSWADALASG